MFTRKIQRLMACVAPHRGNSVTIRAAPYVLQVHVTVVAL
jgi:hypothetical protein